LRDVLILDGIHLSQCIREVPFSTQRRSELRSFLFYPFLSLFSEILNALDCLSPLFFLRYAYLWTPPPPLAFLCRYDVFSSWRFDVFFWPYFSRTNLFPPPLLPERRTPLPSSNWSPITSTPCTFSDYFRARNKCALSPNPAARLFPILPRALRESSFPSLSLVFFQ